MRFLRNLLFGAILPIALVAGQVCQLVVPANPLTAQGLASPWILQNAPGDTANDCNQAGGTNSAFVEAVVFDTATGQVGVYRPLVVNAANMVSIQPQAPGIAATAVVGLWVHFNGQSITLVSTAGTTSVTDGNCVNMGTGNAQVFGQFAYCNAPNVFSAMQNAVLQGTYVPPAIGTAPADGLPCPTSRDTFVVNQNPSTGIAGNQLLNKNGFFAQDTLTNQGILGAGQFTMVSSTLGNNHNLLNNFVLPALGCATIAVTDLADPNKAKVTSLAVNEIIADMQQAAPQAVVPRNAPMALVNNAANLNQLNAYRAGVNQPAVQDTDAALGTDICMNLGKIALPRLMANQAKFATVHSPNTGDNLFNFMLVRMNATFQALNCAGLGVANPTIGVALVQSNFAAAATTAPVAVGGQGQAAAGGGTTIMGMTGNTLIGVIAGASAGVVVVGGVAGYFVRQRIIKGRQDPMLMDQFL